MRHDLKLVRRAADEGCKEYIHKAGVDRVLFLCSEDFMKVFGLEKFDSLTLCIETDTYINTPRRSIQCWKLDGKSGERIAKFILEFI